MPKVINNVTGEVVAELPYDQSGENIATDMAADNPSLDVQFGENADFSPGGISNAPDRMVNSPFPTDVGAPIAPTAPIAPAGTPVLGEDVNAPSLYKKGGKVKHSRAMEKIY